jgi:hypothetical protein
MKAIAIVASLGIGLSGCANLTATQRDNLSLQLALAKQIGTDALQIWCAASGIVFVISDNFAAQSKVTAALKNNANAAAAACPMIANVTGVQGLTTSQAAGVTAAGAAVTISPVTDTTGKAS